MVFIVLVISADSFSHLFLLRKVYFFPQSEWNKLLSFSSALSLPSPLWFGHAALTSAFQEKVNHQTWQATLQGKSGGNH